MGVWRLADDFQSVVGPICGKGPKVGEWGGWVLGGHGVVPGRSAHCPFPPPPLNPPPPLPSPQSESPAVFFPSPHEYAMIGSHLTGWSANEAILLTLQSNATTGPCGEWQVGTPPVFGPGADKTYGSQATFVFDIPNPAGGPPLWVYMGDRWNYDGPLPGEVANATYAWLPILPLAGDAGSPGRWMIANAQDWTPAQMYGKAVSVPDDQIRRKHTDEDKKKVRAGGGRRRRGGGWDWRRRGAGRGLATPPFASTHPPTHTTLPPRLSFFSLPRTTRRTTRRTRRPPPRSGRLRC